METSSIALLRKAPVFAGLDDLSLAALAQHSRRRRYPAGEALCHEGDPGQTLYVVVSGSVNVERMSDAGQTVHIARNGPGETVGELSLIDGKPRMADVVTAEPCELLMLDRGDFLCCLQEHPQIAIQVMACLAERLRGAAGRIQTLAVRDVPARVADLLLCLAAAQGTQDAAGRTTLRLQMTQQEMADDVGTTRESVNRALASLKATGAIRQEGRQVTIVNREKLRRRAEG